jgi:hypothetical protein
LSNKIDALTTENEKMNTSLENKKLEIETWKQRYEESENINKRKCDSYEVEIQQLTIKNENLIARLEHFEKNNETLNKNVKKADVEHGSLLEKLKKSKDEEI